MKPNSRISLGVVCVSFLFSNVFSDHSNKLEVFTDTSAAGWAYMDTCITFQIQIDSSCSVSWTVIKTKASFNNPEGKLALSAHPYDCRSGTKCPFSFHSVAEKNIAILDSIFSRWPPSRFDKVSYSSFRHGDDYSWNIPIAIVSSKSPKYREYRLKYPNTKYNVNKLFVEFANESNAYRELKDLFVKYRLELKLTAVEKVFTAKGSDVPFKKNLIDNGLGETDRFVWDIAFSYFTLTQMEQGK